MTSPGHAAGAFVLEDAVAVLVFIPGLVSDARVWRPVAEALGRDHVIVDLSEPASITAMAQHALKAVDGRIIPVGHSMGGRVAVEMARLAPERMAGLILADTGHHPLGPGEAEKREAKIALGHADMDGLVAEWLPPMVGPQARENPAMMADLTEMVLTAGPEVHERQIRALMGRPDGGAALHMVTCPVLAITGAFDAWSPLSQHQEIAEMVAGPAEAREVAGVGHFLPYEVPKSFADIAAGWLSGHGL